MKALPLWQPFASLVAAECKRVETRSWPAPPWLVGQRIAIHATKTTRALEFALVDPFLSRLKDARGAGRVAFIDGMLPLGYLLCTVVIDRCQSITETSAAALRDHNPDEYAFGNYSLDEGPRFAWVLRDVHRLDEPVAFTGRQGIFDVPDHLVGVIGAQATLL
jgi:hypothetical protein